MSPRHLRDLLALPLGPRVRSSEAESGFLELAFYRLSGLIRRLGKMCPQQCPEDLAMVRYPEV